MNALAKHTPGPWELRGSRLVTDSQGVVIAEKISANHPGTPEGNALLIAAAPEMAAALLALVDTTNAHCSVDHPALPLARNILREAGLLS